MPQPVATFKAHVNAEIYADVEGAKPSLATRLQQFCFGEVTYEPVPKPPYLPESRLWIQVLLRHKRIWPSGIEADALWDEVMMPWLQRRLPQLGEVVEEAERFQIRHGKAPLGFDTLDVRIPPYTFRFPDLKQVDYAELAGQIDRFRDAVNGSGPLSEVGGSIASVEMPWLPGESICARYEERQEREAATRAAIEAGAPDAGEPGPATAPFAAAACAAELADAAAAAPTPAAPSVRIPQANPANGRLWKITLTDGSMRLHDCDRNAWVEHDFANEPVREADEEATRRHLKSLPNQTRSQAKPLLYQDAKIRIRQKADAESLSRWAAARFEALADKRLALDEALNAMEGAAIGVSGGVNSAVLAIEARRVLGDKAAFLFCGNAPFVCARRLRAVDDLERLLGAPIQRHDHPCASDPEVRRNTYLACYHCRYAVFSQLQRLAQKRGLAVLAQGENLDLASGIAKGRRAARELGVRSPLAEAGLTQEDVDAWAHVLGLPFVHADDRACAASRLDMGVPVDDGLLALIDSAEASLAARLGLRSLRLCPEADGVLRISVDDDEMQGLLGIESQRAINYRELTRLGNEWTPSERRDAGQPAVPAKPAPAASATDGEAVAPETTPASENASPADETSELARPACSYVQSDEHLGQVLRDLFDEMRAAGFPTILVEDRLEHKVRLTEDDPWWIERPRRVNASGRS